MRPLLALRHSIPVRKQKYQARLTLGCHEAERGQPIREDSDMVQSRLLWECAPPVGALGQCAL